MVDVYDALVSDRPYRKALPMEKAFAVLRADVQAGKIDGAVVAALEQLVLRKNRNPEGSAGALQPGPQTGEGMTWSAERSS